MGCVVNGPGEARERRPRDRRRPRQGPPVRAGSGRARGARGRDGRRARRRSRADRRRGHRSPARRRRRGRRPRSPRRRVKSCSRSRASTSTTAKTASRRSARSRTRSRVRRPRTSRRCSAKPPTIARSTVREQRAGAGDLRCERGAPADHGAGAFGRDVDVGAVVAHRHSGEHGVRHVVGRLVGHDLLAAELGPAPEPADRADASRRRVPSCSQLARAMSGPAQRAHPGASASRSNTACGDAADRTVISYESRRWSPRSRQPADTSLTGTTRHCGVAGSASGSRNRQKIVPRRCPPVSSQLATPGSRSAMTMRYDAVRLELDLRAVQRRCAGAVLERLHVRGSTASRW